MAIQVRDSKELVERALATLKNEMTGEKIADASAFKQYLRLKYGALDHEQFGITLLDQRQRIVDSITCNMGTINQCVVHPREIVKTALEKQAVAVVLHHNHPSGGKASPSAPDLVMTKQLATALAFVGISVVDHMIVTNEDLFAMSEHKSSRGYLEPATVDAMIEAEKNGPNKIARELAKALGV